MTTNYGNVVPMPGASEAREVLDHLCKSNVISEALQQLREGDETYAIDDETSRQIIKFQSRVLVNRMFGMTHKVLNHLEDHVDRQEVGAQGLTTLAVGLTGRIATLIKSLTDLETVTNEDDSSVMRQIQGMDREQAIQVVRTHFLQLLQDLGTDEERIQIGAMLEAQVDIDQLGTDEGIRAIKNGEVVGSTRWTPRKGPTGILPPVGEADPIS